MRTIAFVNQKGGVAKTTSCLNIADGLHRIKKAIKTLLIDLDPQSHLSKAYNVDSDYSFYNVIIDDIVINDIIITVKPYIDLIPANTDLSAFDISISNITDRERLLKNALSKIKEYDYILIDCSPSLNLLTINALVCATELIIPLQPEYFALHGLSQLLDTIEVVKDTYNNNLVISGILLTRYDKRLKLHNEVLEQLETYFQGKVFKTKIRQSIALAEAPSGAKSIFEYKPNSNGAKDYIAVCREIIKQG